MHYQDEPPVGIVKDTKYSKMYRLVWADGSKSIRYTDPDLPSMEDGGPHTYGLYNLIMANDILRNWKQYRYDTQRRVPRISH